MSDNAVWVVLIVAALVVMGGVIGCNVVAVNRCHDEKRAVIASGNAVGIALAMSRRCI